MKSMSHIKEERNLRATIFGIVAIVAIFAIVFSSFYLSDARFNYQTKQDSSSISYVSSASNEDKDFVGGASRAFTSSQPQTNPPVNQNPQTIPVDQLLEQKSNSFNPSQSSQVIVRGNNGEQIIVGTGQGINAQTLPQSIAQNAVIEQFDGYIVKLKDKSVAEKFQELDKKIGTAKTQNSLELKKYQADLLKKQDAEIKSIKSLIPNLKVKRKFATAFNGFHANLTQQEVQKLRNKGYKVWQNMQVKAVLMDSVPLINADDVWKLDSNLNQCEATGKDCLTGKGIKIAIIDTGVDYTHPDLGGCLGQGCKVEGGYDVINRDNDPMDDMGHGTHVAATAAGNGVLKGVAPDADIYAYKVLDAGGFGSWETIIAGIERAIDPNQDGDFSDKADIISMSLGGYGDPDDPQSQAVDNAVNIGTVAVVAAGNSGPGGNPYCRHESTGNEQSICSPSTARRAITVGATDKNDAIAGFSSRGPVVWSGQSIIKPDIVAPGVSICAAEYDNAWSDSKCLDDKHIAISGTSMATPHVAGAAALLKQKNPDWSPQEIKAAFRSTIVDLGYDILTQGYGRVDILKTVKSIKPPIAELEPQNFNVKGTVNIQGTATGDNFEEYTLYYGQGLNPQSFTKFFTSTSSIVSGNLATLDTTLLNEGYNIIKLVVIQNDTTSSEDRILIKVNNFEINAIGKTRNYIKGQVPIYGNIYLSPMPQFQIEYSNDQINWLTICPNNLPIPSGALCTIDVNVFTNGIYFFRLSIFYNSSRKLDDLFFKAVVVQELMNNWPIEINGAPFGHHIVENLDDDLQKEIIVPQTATCFEGGCSDTQLVSIEHDGTYKVINKLSDGSRVPFDFSPSIIFDEETKSNLVVIMDDLNIGAKIIDKNGNIKYSGWNVSTFPSGFLAFTPTSIFNRNIDDKYEIYSIFMNYTRCPVCYGLTFDEIRVYGSDKKGNVLNGFPIIIEKENGYDGTRASPVGQTIPPIFIRERNSYNLAVFANYYLNSQNFWSELLYLYLYAPNGTVIRRVTLFNETNKSLSLLHVAVGDLNMDGNHEMALGNSITDLELLRKEPNNIDAYKSVVQIINGKGELIGKPLEINGYTITNLVIGNLGLGSPIMVVSLGPHTLNYGYRIIAFDISGKNILDHQLVYDEIVKGVTIGDIDNDGKSEVIVSYGPRLRGSPSGVQIFDASGILKKKIIIPTFGDLDDYSDSYPTLTDLNSDGRTDILLKSWFYPQGYFASGGALNISTRIYALTLNQTYKEANMDWPTFLHDTQHTATFEPVNIPVLPDLTIPQASVTKEKIGYSYKALVSNTGTKESGLYVFQVKEQNLLPRIKLLSSLKPGESRIVKGLITKLPVTFTVDPKNLIKELNENNNNLTITKIITANFPSLKSEDGP